MKKIMLNTNQPVLKEAEAVKNVIAESPTESTVKFAWDDNRFTIEHHRIFKWTIAIENAESHQPVLYKDNISTFELAEILNKYLK